MRSVRTLQETRGVQSLLEHADRLSHWCLACDKRNAKRGYGNQEVSWPAGVTLPHRETQCQVCKAEWRFDTDRDGCMVQICKCGMAYVAIKLAPKRERKPCGKRSGKGIDNLAKRIKLEHAHEERKNTNRPWVFYLGDPGPS